MPSPQTRPVDLESETPPHVALCVKGFDGKRGRSARKTIAIDDAFNVPKRTGPLETRAHFQKKQCPPQDRREDSNYPQWPSPKQMESKARAAGGDGQQQQPLAKPPQGSRADHFPFPDVASYSFKSALHFALRNRHHGLSLAKALRYVHYIQCVVCACTASLGYGCSPAHSPMTA